MNTDFIDYIKKIETDYPLDYTLTKGCFLISNSGRRGLAKEFYLEEKSLYRALVDIKENISKFSKDYNEDNWRKASDFFSINAIKSFCGVQTRPFFETINKIISWGCNKDYVEGKIDLTENNIEKTLKKIEDNSQHNKMRYLVNTKFSQV